MSDQGTEMDPGRFDDLASWGSPKPQTKKPPIRNLISDESCWVEADIPKRPWIAPSYVMRGHVTLLAGVPGGGKSSMAVSWAAALALGKSFGGFEPIKASRVATYNTEDDADEQRRRFSATMRHLGRPISDLTGQLLRVGVERIGTLFGMGQTEAGVEFGPLAAMDELAVLLEDFEPDVLILDPLVELHDRDENDNTQLRRVVAEFRTLAVKYDIAVVLLHHTRKGSASAAGDADSIRGGGAIVGAVRVALTLTKMSEDDAKGLGISEANRHYYIRLDEAKSNYSSTATDWFEKVVHKLDNGDAVMALAPWQPPVDVLSVSQRQDIEAGLAAGSATGPWSAKLSKDARSVKQLLVQCGVTTVKGQSLIMNEMLTSGGYVVANFKRQNRGSGSGIRSSTGQPTNVIWLSEPDGAEDD